MELIRYFKLNENDEYTDLLCRVVDDLKAEMTLLNIQQAKVIKAMTDRDRLFRTYIQTKLGYTLSPNQVVFFDDQEKEIKILKKQNNDEPEIE